MIGSLRTSMAASALAFAFAFALNACSGTDAPLIRTSVRDSAGVRIVENLAPDDAPILQVVAEPVLSVGDVSGDTLYELSSISGATLLNNGGIAISMSRPGLVRLYDDRGAFLRTVGRRGDGPGEYSRPFAVRQLRADTLLIVNDGLHLILVRDNGEFLEERSGTLAFLGYLDDRVALAKSRTTRTDADLGLVTDVSLFLVDKDGDKLAPVGPPRLKAMLVNASGGMTPHFGLDPVADARGSSIVVADSTAARIVLYDSKGNTRMIVRTSIDPEIVDDELRRKVRDFMLAQSAPEYRSQVEAMLAQMPFADVVPPFDLLKLGVTGEIWARRFLQPWEVSQSWLRFSSDGTLLNRLSLTSQQVLHEAGPDWLLIESRNLDDVPSVGLWRFDSR